MRTTDERLAAAMRRAEEIERQERRRRGKIAVLACSAACLAMIFALALAMPYIAARLSGAEYGVGLTDEKAEAELQQIADEGKITTRALDIFGAQTIE